MLNMSAAARSLTGDQELVISGQVEVLPSVTPRQPQMCPTCPHLTSAFRPHVPQSKTRCAAKSGKKKQQKTFSKGVLKEESGSLSTYFGYHGN